MSRLVPLLALCCAVASSDTGKQEPDTESVGVSGVSSKRIGDVIDSIRDILDTVESEEKAETENYGSFVEWCRTQKTSTADALKQATMQSEESVAAVEELSATVTKLQQVLDDTAQETQEAKDTVTQATNLREGNVERYNDDMQLNRQSTSQVTEAVRIIGGVQPVHLLQSGEKGKTTQKLRMNSPGESSYVLGILKGLKDRLTDTRDGLKTDESGEVERHEKFVKGETARITSLLDSHTQTQLEHNTARVDLAESQRLGEKLEVQITDLKRLLSAVTERCEAKAVEWKARAADRAEEKVALHEAIDFLTKYTDAQATNASGLIGPVLLGAPSFLQASFLRAVAHGTSSHQSGLATAHAQLAALVVSAADGRSNIPVLHAAREVVGKVLATLQQKQTQQAEMNKYCKKELEKATGEQASVAADIERVNATIERKASEADLQAGEITAIDNQLETRKVELKKATEIRKKEKQIYTEGKHDRALAVKVLAQAQKVLRDFYKPKVLALAQAMVHLGAAPAEASESAAPPETWSSTSESRKTLRSAGVVEVLGKVAEDISREQKAAANEENDASAAFEQLQIDAREEFDDQMQAMTQRLKTKAKLKVSLGTDKETRTQKVEDHSAVSQELTGLHNECDELIANIEPASKARAFEISQLRDIIDILSGSRVAARTGFLAKSEQDFEHASVDERELSLLRDMSQSASSLTLASKA